MQIFNLKVDDFRAIFNICCCTLGLGSLSLARSYSSAGPVYATMAIILMCAINIYSTNCLSKCMFRAPSHVKTFGDLGFHLGGNFGRYVVVICQFGSCILTPVAFLVLGGGFILPRLFGTSLSPNFYIPLMAICLIPVVLIRNLKEGAYVALIGAAGTLFGDFFAVVDSFVNSPHYGNIATAPQTMNVISVFGSLSLAYGVSVVIPGIQRNHPDPTRLPFLIAISILAITMVYIVLGVTGYVQYGCIAPANLLKSMSMHSDPVMETFALCSFMVHIMIAYSVLLNPALYIFERYVFGFNKTTALSRSFIEDSDLEKTSDSTMYFEKNERNVTYLETSINQTPKVLNKKMTMSMSFSGDSEDEVDDVFTVKERLQSYALRITVVAVQTFIAMLLQGCFDALADFIGSSSITLSCIIIPVLMYLKMYPNEIQLPERIWAYFIIILCTILGAWTSYISMNTMYHTVLASKPFHSVGMAVGAKTTYDFCKPGAVPFEL